MWRLCGSLLSVVVHDLLRRLLYCSVVLPLQDVVKTTRAAGAARFAALLESSGLADQLRREGAAFTVFAPSDQAMDVSRICPAKQQVQVNTV